MEIDVLDAVTLSRLEADTFQKKHTYSFRRSSAYSWLRNLIVKDKTLNLLISLQESGVNVFNIVYVDLFRNSLSYEEVELIRRRAEAFLRNAGGLINEGEWDLAVFNLEQYCQLILKYKLLVKKGSYPRTHSLKSLIRILGDDNPELLKLIQDEGKLHYIARLEEAYIVSRYLPYVFEEREVKDIYRFVIEVFKPIVEKI